MQTFQILIVFAVKMCKQGLQTASASGDPRIDPLSGFRPGLHALDDGRYPRIMKIPGVASVNKTANVRVHALHQPTCLSPLLHVTQTNELLRGQRGTTLEFHSTYCSF